MSKTIDRQRAPAALLFAGLACAGLCGMTAGAPAALAQSGWSNSSSPEDFRYRLDVLDAELADLRARLGGAAATAPQSGGWGGSLSNSGQAALESEIRRLTAAVEELQHRVSLIGEEAARRFSDIEFRLTELEGGDITTLQPVPPLGVPSSESPAAPGASPSQTQVQPPLSGIVAGPQGQGSFPGVEVPLSGQANGQQGRQQLAAVSPQQQSDLDRAVQDVRQGRYDQAEDRLRRFLNDYPDSALKPEAWYWLGESQFVRGNHAEAARSFLSGYQADSTGSRAPHNLYRLGVTLGRLGQTNEACATLREVRNRFPSADGVLGQVSAESEALGCG